jgi:hypothetical protein
MTPLAWAFLALSVDPCLDLKLERFAANPLEGKARLVGILGSDGEVGEGTISRADPVEYPMLDPKILLKPCGGCKFAPENGLRDCWCERDDEECGFPVRLAKSRKFWLLCRDNSREGSRCPDACIPLRLGMLVRFRRLGPPAPPAA